MSERRAKHNTLTLSLLFGAAMLFLISGIDLVLAILLMNETRTNGAQPTFTYEFANWFLPVAGVIILIVGIAAIYKSTQVREGGPSIAAMLDAVPLDPNTIDPDEKRLKDVVEEMALAASIPTPAIYILYDEPNINAFAAGRTTADAVIGVTYGCLKLLNRDELQGIVAHEFSHIVNGDTKLNIRMLSLVYGLLAIALIGQLVVRASFGTRSSGRNNSGLYILAIGAALMVLGFAGSFFGRLVRAAITRQRELLADAAAVQYTRNAAGVAGALRKIGGSADSSYLQHCNAEEANQFLFSDGVASAWTATPFLATHPKLKDRIRLIDPSFDGTFINPGELTLPVKHAVRPDSGNVAPNVMLLAAAAGTAPSRAASALRPPVDPEQLMPPLPKAAAPVVQAAPDRPAPVLPVIRNEAPVRASFPPDVLAAAADPVGAQAVMYALLLSNDAASRAAELSALKSKLDGTAMAALTDLLPTLARLRGGARISLADLSMAGLTMLTGEQYSAFRAVLMDEEHLHVHRDLSTYVLWKIVERYADSYFHPAAPAQVTIDTMADAVSSAAILISTICYIGHGPGVLAQTGFERGFAALGASGLIGHMAKPEECTFDKIDQALGALNTASPSVKQAVLGACAGTVDGLQIVSAEAYAMLRAIADGLGLDVPEYIDDPYNPSAGAVIAPAVQPTA